MSQLFASGGQGIRVSASTSVLPMYRALTQHTYIPSTALNTLKIHVIDETLL